MCGGLGVNGLRIHEKEVLMDRFIALGEVAGLTFTRSARVTSDELKHARTALMDQGAFPTINGRYGPVKSASWWFLRNWATGKWAGDYPPTSKFFKVIYSYGVDQPADDTQVKSATSVM